MGSYLAELGFNLDFAPAADLKVVDGNAAGSSSYGTDATTVASFVTGMQTGLQEQKVTAAIGHLPIIRSFSGGDPEHEEWHGFYGQKCGRFQGQ